MDELMFVLEMWLPVVGYEGFYEVSSRGRVKSLLRRTAKGYQGGRILTGTVAFSGHIAVMLSKHGNIRRRMVHQLVAEAFIGPRPAGQETRHLNDVPYDNRVENLEYGTSAENKQDALRNGHNYFANRTHCPQNHAYDEANTYITPTGHRDCRACGNDKTKIRKHAQALGLTGEPCSTPGCTSSATAGGLCPKCYVRRCRAERRGPDWAKRTCPQCGADFELAQDKRPRKYCSKECYAEVRRTDSRERARARYRAAKQATAA